MSSISASSSELPLIPRYWWLKRIVAVSVLIFVALSFVRLAWGWDANRRIEAALDDIPAHGESFNPADFDTPRVPDADNYIRHFENAVAALAPNVYSPANSDEDFPDYPPYPTQWHTLAQKAINANPEAFRLIRNARAYPQVDWKPNLVRPLRADYNRTLTGGRSLANLLSDTAITRHLEGNDAEALELIRDVLGMADAVYQGPALVDYLVAMGFQALAIHRVQVIAPGIRFQDAQPAATRQQVRELIVPLLDDQNDQRIQRVFQFDRIQAFDIVDQYTRNNMLLHPMFMLDLELIFQSWRRSIDAIQLDDFSQAKALFPEQPRRGINLSLLGTPPETNIRELPRELSATFSFSPISLMQTALRQRAARRSAVVSLAVALYLADHDGNFPADLNELVPLYLPAVPIDPFSSTKEPLRYVLYGDTRRPLVYSVGPDGVDDTTAGSPVPAEPQFGTIRTADQYTDLSRFDPPKNQSQ